MKYFITKRQKQKKLKLHWLKYGFQQLYFLQQSTWYYIESESHHCTFTDGPNQKSTFWALIMSIVLETKSGVCSKRTIYVLPFPFTVRTTNKALTYFLY